MLKLAWLIFDPGYRCEIYYSPITTKLLNCVFIFINKLLVFILKQGRLWQLSSIEKGGDDFIRTKRFWIHQYGQTKRCYRNFWACRVQIWFVSLYSLKSLWPLFLSELMTVLPILCKMTNLWVNLGSQNFQNIRLCPKGRVLLHQIKP